MKRIGLISGIYLMLLTLALNGCQTNPYQQKQTIIIKQFDKVLSLTRDTTTNQLYFQSKNGEPKGQCGEYWYSGNANFTHNNQQILTNLNELIDSDSLVLDGIDQNIYRFHDKFYRYTLVMTLCDNTVSYEKI